MSELCRIFINLITLVDTWQNSWNFMLGAQSVPRSTNTSAETMMSLAESSIHDRLDKASPLVDQTQIKFDDVSYCGSVNFLLQYTPDAIVDWTQIRWIRRPQCWRNEVWHLLLQESDGVACSMRQCTVLLKYKTSPWDIRNIPDLARKLSRNYVFFSLTPGSIKWISVQPLISYYLSVM